MSCSNGSTARWRACFPTQGDQCAWSTSSDESAGNIVGDVVRVLPSGRRFTVQGTDTLLDSALQSGITLEHGCANGSCGLCKARLIEGDIERVRFHDHVLPEREKRRGVFLLCSNTAHGNVVVEAQIAGEPDDLPRQRIKVKVQKIEEFDDVTLLSLRTPRSQVLHYLSGQSITLELADGSAQNVPLASCPCDGLNLELHLGAGTFAQKLTRARRGSRLVIDGPHGNFLLDESTPGPQWFFAEQHGFGPIKGLIEHLINLELEYPVRLLRTTPHNTPPYAHNLCRTWADALDDFRYEWSQQTTELTTPKIDAWSNTDSPPSVAYICGSQPFVSATSTKLSMTHPQLNVATLVI